jgi:hypothetical protein
MNEPRYFTIDEANAVLVEAGPRVEQLMRAHQTMEDLQEIVTTSIPTNGGGEAHRMFLDAAREAAGALDALNAEGIVVRDPSSGLIDFYSKRDGEDVFLCWRVGEDSIGWWHPVDTGFAGRRPL